MASARLSLIVMLLASVNGAGSEKALQPCAEVQASSAVVALGSSVSATCAIRADCPVPIDPTVRLEWRLDENVLPSGSVANQSGTVSRVVIPSFNSTMAFLTCRVQSTPPQTVGGVKIQAGHLPSIPQHLHCVTNLTEPITLLCSWDPGPESHLPTKYNLHTYISGSNNYSYDVPAGHHHYVISRSDLRLFADMEIFVKAANQLGEIKSAKVILEPVSAAKFDPPEILNVYALRKRYGCLRMQWKLSQHETWVQNMNFEAQVMAAKSDQQSDKHIYEKRARPSKYIDLCNLLNGTRYMAQIRVRYQQSPWSEWSRSHSGVTLESAPTGHLDSWMKVSGDHMHKQVSVHLFWKPSKQFRANGQNVSYVVSRTSQPGERGQLCATAGRHCTFQAPVKAKVYLSAVNAVGRSTPTKIRVYRNKDLEAITQMTVTPNGDTSLLVQWTCGHFDSLLGFVVEWRPLLKIDPAYVQFQLTNKTQTSFIISGSIEPYKPYGISVYPRFKDGIGRPRTANAFSKEKAPSMVPQLKIKKSWHLGVELSWDEIPLDQMNGMIQNYTVYYEEDNGAVSVVAVTPDKRGIFLQNLNPRSVYKALLMVSTFGGSKNGSMIVFKTESSDIVSVVISVTFSMALILVCMIIFLHYTSNSKRFINNFCPIIPDPANSSIKEWSTESLEEILHEFSSKEPSLVYLSHLSLLEIPPKVQKEEDDGWLSNAEDTSDLGESICGSPTIPGYCGSNTDSVPYATVVFSTSTSPRENHTYLRSESTQPLLEAEEAFTPKCYQNIPAEETNSEQCFFGSSDRNGIEEVPVPDIEWDEFPFLSALEMNDSENN